MKILLGTFTIADSPDPIPMTDFRVNGSRNIQEAQFFRATARQFYDRGNRKTEITFNTSRAWKDKVSAESFILMHETQFAAARGLVTFIAGTGGGGATAMRYLVNAVVESVSSSLTGCTTKHSYRITGGVMTISPA